MWEQASVDSLAYSFGKWDSMLLFFGQDLAFIDFTPWAFGLSHSKEKCLTACKISVSLHNLLFSQHEYIHRIKV